MMIHCNGEQLHLHPFNHSPELSRHILSYLHPKQMFIAAHCSKTSMAGLHIEDVVYNCLHTGGGPMKSIMALYPLMQKGVVYVMSPARTLELCIGTECEYCKKSVKYSGRTGMTYCVRPTFGIKACKTCLMQDLYGRNFRTYHTINDDDIDDNQKLKSNKEGANVIPKKQWALTCLFQKIVSNSSQEYHNQYYLANREVIYEILTYSRVAAYPRNIRRYFDGNNNPTIGVNAVWFSDDSDEIMQTDTLFDCTGKKTGAIFTRKMLSSLVDYLKLDGNLGVEHFFNNMIPGCPSMSMYQPFINAYEQCIESARVKHSIRVKMSQERRQLQQYEKVELAVKGISKIAVMMSPNNIYKWKKPPLYRSHSTSRTKSSIYDSNVMQRVMLMYREITYPRAKWCLTFDTSSPRLDKLLHSILDSFLANPISMSKKSASAMAYKIYHTIINQTRCKRHVGIYKDISWEVKQSGYARRYRREYINRGTPRVFRPWRDRSSERVL